MRWIALIVALHAAAALRACPGFWGGDLGGVYLNFESPRLSVEAQGDTALAVRKAIRCVDCRPLSVLRGDRPEAGLLVELIDKTDLERRVFLYADGTLRFYSGNGSFACKDAGAEARLAQIVFPAGKLAPRRVFFAVDECLEWKGEGLTSSAMSRDCVRGHVGSVYRDMVRTPGWTLRWKRWPGITERYIRITLGRAGTFRLYRDRLEDDGLLFVRANSDPALLTRIRERLEKWARTASHNPHPTARNPLEAAP